MIISAVIVKLSIEGMFNCDILECKKYRLIICVFNQVDVWSIVESVQPHKIYIYNRTLKSYDLKSFLQYILTH